jgi:hypothetical protein
MRIVRESLDFERGKEPKDSLDIGVKVIIELMNGYKLQGFRRNLEQVMPIVNTINAEMEEAYESNQDEGESVAMDARDERVWVWEKELDECGFKLVEDFEIS